MELTELFLAELDREADRSSRALAQVPDGKHDWKPHEKSIIFGYLAGMVANIPSWIAMVVSQDELDIAPKDGPKQDRPALNTSAEYSGAREAPSRRPRGVAATTESTS